MPSFFQFQQGTERRARGSDAESPLLGRFRALPNISHSIRRRTGSVGNLFSAWTRAGGGSGYGTVRRENDEDSVLDSDDEEDTRGWIWTIKSVFVDPKPAVVKRLVHSWFGRLGALVILPALVVSTRLSTSGELY
jgi:hypothetical protein